MERVDTSEVFQGVERIPSLRAAGVHAFFFDMDGTLAPIVDLPRDARVPDVTLEILQRLVKACSGALAIVSGRPLAEIDDLLSPWAPPAAGLHGAQWRGPDGVEGHLRVDEDAVADMARSIEPLMNLHPGLLLEQKGLSLAVHYRSVPDCAELVRGTMEQVAQGHKDFVLQPGKMVVEIKPRSASKARAIEQFMQQSPFKGRRPVFVGDDLTDEPGFDVVNALGGISIKIGGGPTSAHWRLADPSSLSRWLAALE